MAATGTRRSSAPARWMAVGHPRDVPDRSRIRGAIQAGSGGPTEGSTSLCLACSIVFSILLRLRYICGLFDTLSIQHLKEEAVMTRAPVILFALAAAGCASTQLNHNTLDLAGTVDQLVIEQIHDNILRFVKDPYAIPSLVSLPGGSATTQGTMGASIASNRTIAQAITTSLSVTPSVSDTWSQNWALAPITDPDQMRRVRAIYRYALGYTIDRNKLKEQHCIFRNKDGSCPTIQDEYAVIYKSGTGDKIGVAMIDQIYLRKPSCILCLPDTKPGALITPPVQVEENTLGVNDRLKQHLLRWRGPDSSNVEIDSKKDVLLKAYGPYELFAAGRDSKNENKESFAEFILFVLEATQNSTSGAGGGKGNGGKPVMFNYNGILTPQ